MTTNLSSVFGIASSASKGKGFPLQDGSQEILVDERSNKTDDIVFNTKPAEHKCTTAIHYPVAQPKSWVRAKNATTPCKTDTERGNQNIAEILDTVLMIYGMFGFNAKYFKTSRSFRIHQTLSEGLSSMKYWKYRFAAFFSYWKGQPLPKCIIPQENLDALRIDDFNTHHASTILYGRGHRFVDHLSREKIVTVWPSFLQSILMIKKGLNRPEDLDVVKGLMETFEMLTHPNKITANRSNHQVFEVERFQLANDGTLKRNDSGGIRLGRLFRTAIRDTIEEVFQHSSEDDIRAALIGSDPRIPSTNANYVQGRNLAGTLGLVQDMFRLPELYPDFHSNPIYREISDDFSKFRAKYGSSLFEFINRNVNKVETSSFHNEYISSDDIDSLYLDPYVVSEIEYIASKFSTLIRHEANKEDSNVTLVGLKEPLKVRVISKGPPITYYSLKPLQKFFHGEMRQHRVFKFIGQPVSEEAIYSIFGELKERQGFLSGDYKDATNNMHPLLGSLTVNALADFFRMDDIHPIYRQLMHKALTGHVVDNPAKDALKAWYRSKSLDNFQRLLNFYRYYRETYSPNMFRLYKGNAYLEYIDRYTMDPNYLSFDDFVPHSISNFIELYDGHMERDQLNGQLMGSPMSFIVLCLVNAALLKAVDYLLTGRKRLLSEMPLTVNGDDFVYKTVPKGYRIWQNLTPYTGMEESVGKTFYSREFLNMNSREFLYINNSYSIVPFINLGLVHGLKRSEIDVVATGSERGLHDEGSLSTRAYEALLTAPRFVRGRLYDYLLNHNLPILTKIKLPWFVPAEYGGVGLPILLYNNELWNWKSQGFPRSITHFPQFLDDENLPKTFSGWFHHFGQTPTYPSQRNLSGLAYLMTGPNYPIERITPVTDPVIFNMHRAVKKHLPHPIFRNFSEHMALKVSDSTPRLQLLFLFYSLFSPPNLFYREEEKPSLRRLKSLLQGSTQRNIKVIDEVLSSLQEDYSFFKQDDPALINFNNLVAAERVRPLMAIRSIANNESIWREASSKFVLPFDVFEPKFRTQTYRSLNL